MLSLTEAQRAALADMGMVTYAAGFRAASGAEVEPGVAARLIRAARVIADGSTETPAGDGLPVAQEIDDGSDVTGEDDDDDDAGKASRLHMPQPHAVEPADFRRPLITAGHEAAPPANDPGGNNPHPGGTPASAVLGTAAARLAVNAGQAAREHVAGSAVPAYDPAPGRAVMSPDLAAANVPAARMIAAARPCPGETR